MNRSSSATHEPLGFFELCLRNPIPSDASIASATAPVGSNCFNPAELLSTAAFSAPKTCERTRSARSKLSARRVVSYGAVSVLSLSNTRLEPRARRAPPRVRMSGTSTCGRERLARRNAMPKSDTPATFTLCIAALHEEEGAGSEDAASSASRDPRGRRGGVSRGTDARGAASDARGSTARARRRGDRRDVERAPQGAARSRRLPASVSAAIVARAGAPSTRRACASRTPRRDARST